jgi:hypothetical protein
MDEVKHGGQSGTNSCRVNLYKNLHMEKMEGKWATWAEDQNHRGLPLGCFSND